MKIITIIGARPQFIKAAAVSAAVRESQGIEEKIVHTGQHYDAGLSDIFFDELDIPAPAYHLGVGSASHGAQTGRMLGLIEEVFKDEKPDWVLVYGDTNSTLAGSLAAVKLHIPVAHVEAGLRSFNRQMPEEINRILTDHASDLLFTPTETATAHLRQEGIPEDRIRYVGDVMYDATLQFGKKAERESTMLRDLRLPSKGFVLSTIHRAENTNDLVRLRVIFDALGVIHQEIPVVLPLHPRTKHALERAALLGWASERVRFVEPVGYLDMLVLEQRAKLIATDSGGIQKEAYFAGTPCVTLRDQTEWTELIELGWNRLAPPTDRDSVVAHLRAGLSSGPGRNAAPYGRGDSAMQILHHLSAST